MNIIPYFFRKLVKIPLNLSSAAVVIGALRVNIFYVSSYQKCYIDTSLQRLTPKAKIELNKGHFLLNHWTDYFQNCFIQVMSMLRLL